MHVVKLGASFCHDAAMMDEMFELGLNLRICWWLLVVHVCLVEKIGPRALGQIQAFQKLERRQGSCLSPSPPTNLSRPIYTCGIVKTCAQQGHLMLVLEAAIGLVRST